MKIETIWGMSNWRPGKLNRLTFANIENMKTTPNLETAILNSYVFKKKINDIFFGFCVNHELQGRGDA